MIEAAAVPRASSGATALVDLRDVSYQIGSSYLVRDITLKIVPGEVLVVVGPNGAGKSTLVQLIAGDLPPSSGTILLDGRPISSWKPHDLAMRRAVLPQQSLLQFAFTVQEVVEMGRSPHDDSPHDLAHHVDRALERTELTTMRTRIYPTLSGGEQARTQLGRVIAQDTPILILDEPTASLDLRHQYQVMAIARELANRGGSVIAVVHDLNLASSTADRIVLIDQGRIAADGTPAAVLEESLLSAVYQCQIAVSQHPLLACPLVLPIGRRQP